MVVKRFSKSMSRGVLINGMLLLWAQDTFKCAFVLGPVVFRSLVLKNLVTGGGGIGESGSRMGRVYIGFSTVMISLV
jgi:hypothetical protein